MADTGPGGFLVCCDDVRVELGGKISLMGVFREIGSTSFPATHPRFFTVIFLRGREGEADLELELEGPKPVKPMPLWAKKVRGTGKGQDTVEVVALSQVEFSKPGSYSLLLKESGHVLDRAGLQILETKV